MFQVLDKTKGAAKCRSCGATITWFEMAKSGKRMPFDGDPVYVKTDTKDGALVGFIDGTMFPSHFATCAQADEWRKR